MRERHDSHVNAGKDLPVAELDGGSADRQTARLLIVEDDPTIGRFVELELMHAGHAVRRVTDGESALSVIAEDAPRLVILDIMLPGLDGWSVLAELRRASSIPVILLTARDRAEGVTIEFNLEGLLRGDSAGRASTRSPSQ